MGFDKAIKCVVWDLDNTLWEGVLFEDKNICIHDESVKAIKEFDHRGILNAIASRNDYDQAKKKLTELNLWHYFIYPQINWNNKSASITKIANDINIASDSIAFIDDQKFELDEVKSVHPNVTCMLPAELWREYNSQRFKPRFITAESKKRRQYYQNDIIRRQEEKEYQASNLAFLQNLDLELTIRKVTLDDLQRAEELTIRTHQLNTTGITYNYEQLKSYMNSDEYLLLCCSLKDRYGEYGTIGLVLIEKQKNCWILKLLLMSCRVMSRNAGSSVLAFLIRLSRKHKVTLQADFVESEVNRQMYIAYKFNGFKEKFREKNYILLEFSSEDDFPIPQYMHVRSDLL